MYSHQVYKTVYWPISKGYNCFILINQKLILLKSIFSWKCKGNDLTIVTSYCCTCQNLLICYENLTTVRFIKRTVTWQQSNNHTLGEKYDIIIMYLKINYYVIGIYLKLQTNATNTIWTKHPILFLFHSLLIRYFFYT